MMNLKPAIRYQVRDYVVSSLIFAGVNLLIVVLMVAGLLYFQVKTGTDSISYNGYTLSCTIFQFVLGLIVPRQVTRLCAQLGVCRRTAFLSLFPPMILASLLLAVLGEGMLGIAREVSASRGGPPLFSDLFTLIYLSDASQPTLVQHGLAALFNTAYMLVGFCLGLFLTFLFWRLNKIGCILAGLAIPAVLVGLPALMGLFPTLFAPVIRLAAQFGRLWVSSPWWAMVFALILVLLFAGIGWLLIRRTNIRAGSLSK